MWACKRTPGSACHCNGNRVSSVAVRPPAGRPRKPQPEHPLASRCAAASSNSNTGIEAGLQLHCSRRSLLQLGGATLLAGGLARSPALAAPLTVDQVADVIRGDFSERQYYVTGDLTTAVFDPDCIFIDPTTTVKGVKPYTSAVANLFDPASSRADLIDLQVVDPNTILLRWRLEGKLKLGGLAIKPYTGSTVYTLNADGRVVSHVESWDISALDAFVSTFFPGFGAPPAAPVQQSQLQ